jgi:hypothetical protein
LESILAEYEVFAAAGGCATLTGRSEGQRLSRGGAHNHNVDGTTTVFGIGEDHVGPFIGVVVRRDLLFPVYRCVAPIVEKFMKRVGDRLVSLDSAGSISATHGVVAFSVAVTGALSPVGAPQRARSWSQDVVRHTYADGEIKDLVGHEVGRLGGELEPRPGV